LARRGFPSALAAVSESAASMILQGDRALTVGRVQTRRAVQGKRGDFCWVRVLAERTKFVENTKVNLSPTFLSDLAKIHASLRPQALSAEFLSDLADIHATLLAESDANLPLLATRFDHWRSVTKDFVHTCIAALPDDDPLSCPISLFRTMDYGRLETAHTRTLAWLLNPDAEHGFRSKLLEAFLARLTGQDQFDRIQVERVVSECPVDGAAGKGRCDVVAQGQLERRGRRSLWTLVIEAKVDAWEGEVQLDKYDGWLRAHAADGEIYRVFITPDGRNPDTGGDKWMSLSFLDLAQAFRSVYDELRLDPGFHFLRFYLAGVLQDICEWPRNVKDERADPYAIASYLSGVQKAHVEDERHDTAR
jgi:hypothetical protein